MSQSWKCGKQSGRMMSVPRKWSNLNPERRMLTVGRLYQDQSEPRGRLVLKGNEE